MIKYIYIYISIYIYKRIKYKSNLHLFLKSLLLPCNCCPCFSVGHMSQFNDQYRKSRKMHFNSNNSVGFLDKEFSKEKSRFLFISLCIFFLPASLPQWKRGKIYCTDCKIGFSSSCLYMNSNQFAPTECLIRYGRFKIQLPFQALVSLLT